MNYYLSWPNKDCVWYIIRWWHHHHPVSSCRLPVMLDFTFLHLRRLLRRRHPVPSVSTCNHRHHSWVLRVCWLSISVVHKPWPAGRMWPTTGACAAPRRLKEVTIICRLQWALNNSADTETVVSVHLWCMCVSYFLTCWQVAGHSPVWGWVRWGRKVQAVCVAMRLGLRPSTPCPFACFALWPKSLCTPDLYIQYCVCSLSPVYVIAC